MKLIPVLLMLGLMAGCGQSVPPVEQCIPCSVTTIALDGFAWVIDSWGTREWRSRCIPCDKARSPEERFACFGKESRK